MFGAFKKVLCMTNSSYLVPSANKEIDHLHGKKFVRDWQVMLEPKLIFSKFLVSGGMLGF